MKLEQIIQFARRFAAVRSKVVAIVDKIQDAQQSAFDQNRAALKRAVAEANEAQSELATAITMSPECFQDPRTFNVDGIRFGLVTKPGRVEIIDEEQTIAAIKNKYPVLADTLIVVKETVNKKALENLTTEQLERIGLARGVADPNAIVIKPTDSAVDKLVKAMLEDATDSTRDLVA